MILLDPVTTEDLHDALAEVEGEKPTQRLMAAINFLEEDDATMAEVAERYGYTGPWLSLWLDRLYRQYVNELCRILLNHHWFILVDNNGRSELQTHALVPGCPQLSARQ